MTPFSKGKWNTAADNFVKVFGRIAICVGINQRLQNCKYKIFEMQYMAVEAELVGSLQNENKNFDLESKSIYYAVWIIFHI